MATPSYIKQSFAYAIITIWPNALFPSYIVSRHVTEYDAIYDAYALNHHRKERYQREPIYYVAPLPCVHVPN